MVNFSVQNSFINDKHVKTSYGRAYLQGLNQATDRTNHQALFVAMELLRFGLLHGEHFSKSYPMPGSPGTEEEKKHMTLFSRTMCLLQIKHKPVPWVGPLNRELLQFNSFIKTLLKSLRTLAEAVIVNGFLRKRSDKKGRDFTKLGLQLPFGWEVNTGMGILARSYLEKACANRPTEGILRGLEDTFSGCPDVKTEVGRCFAFWDQLVSAVKVLHAEKAINEDLANQFIKADGWMLNKRVSVK